MEPNPKTQDDMAELRKKAAEETYETKVWRMFDNFPMGGWFELARYVDPKNKERFIEAVKLHCDLQMGREGNYYLQPNNAWTHIKKTISATPPPLTPILTK